MNAAVEPFGDSKPRESTQKRKKKEQLSQSVSTYHCLCLISIDSEIILCSRMAF